LYPEAERYEVDWSDGNTYLEHCMEYEGDGLLMPAGESRRPIADEEAKLTHLQHGDVIVSTDIGGGYSLSLVDEIRRSLSKHSLTLVRLSPNASELSFGQPETSRLFTDSVFERMRAVGRWIIEDAPSSVADRLRELKALHDEGILTDDEYESKRKVLTEQL
jgi:hypothetical protein